MKKPKPKKPPITIVVAFGPVTLEKFEALPERVKDAIGQLVLDCLAQRAAAEQAAVGMAA